MCATRRLASPVHVAKKSRKKTFWRIGSHDRIPHQRRNPRRGLRASGGIDIAAEGALGEEAVGALSLLPKLVDQGFVRSPRVSYLRRLPVRRAARTDRNQQEIIRVLRDAGCGVLDLSAVGKGCPDLLVHPPAYPDARMAFLVEIKDGSKSPSRRTLTPDQEKFHREWKGSIFVVTSPEEALKAAGVIT